MSIEMLLIPIGLAAYSAWKAQMEPAPERPQVLMVPTRLLDLEMVEHAAASTGAHVSRVGGTVHASWAEGTVTFESGPDGALRAHSDDLAADAMLAIVQGVDTAYGLQVQQRVVSRVHEQAPALDMTVTESVTQDDGTVLITLEQR